MLAEHPEIAQRLRKEILDVIGPTARPTYENLRDMKYMRAFVNGPSSSTYLVIILRLKHVDLFRGFEALPTSVRIIEMFCIFWLITECDIGLSTAGISLLQKHT